jgi:hypothetical protein
MGREGRAPSQVSRFPESKFLQEKNIVFGPFVEWARGAVSPQRGEAPIE